MKLFKSKKDKNELTASENEALQELIEDMPSQSGGSTNDASGSINNTSGSINNNSYDPNTTNTQDDVVPPAKVKKSLFGRKKAKGDDISPTIHENESHENDSLVNDDLSSSDDFLINLDKKPNNNNSDLLKWLLGGLLILLTLMVLYYLYSTFIADNGESDLNNAELPTLSEGAEPVPVLETEQGSQAQDLDIVNTDDIENIGTVDAPVDAIDDTQIEITTLDDIPDPEEIISAEMPENEVMAKEEIDRLADEAEQLEEQGELIADQVAMMDELTSKKTEQIELLEQQIALLEAQKNSQ